MKAIAGLGNPGPAYEGTRHNIGFAILDELAQRWRVPFKRWKSLAEVAVARDRDALLVKPQTFMNASGEAVQRIVAFHKLEPAGLLIVADEAQLPLGRIRLRPSGSDGGHNGLKSVIQHVGRDVARLRVGVGRGDPDWDLADHVLARFAPDERETVARTVARAADAVEVFLTNGVLEAMNRFNAAEKEVTPDQSS
jgi:PTH1 family peptidyl-tRNA hydrolase